MVKSLGEKARRARRREEKLAAYDAKVSVLRAAGASCGNCQHFGRIPISKDRCCDLDSDFSGYAITTADKICARHARQP